eukprot:96121-Pelagomonas_calceolata.AAC.2
MHPACASHLIRRGQGLIGKSRPRSLHFQVWIGTLHHGQSPGGSFVWSVNTVVKGENGLTGVGRQHGLAHSTMVAWIGTLNHGQSPGVSLVWSVNTVIKVENGLKGYALASFDKRCSLLAGTKGHFLPFAL